MRTAALTNAKFNAEAENKGYLPIALRELGRTAGRLYSLKAYLERETIPYLEQIMKHSAQNEHDMIYKTNLNTVNSAARELRECIQDLKKYIGEKL